MIFLTSAFLPSASHRVTIKGMNKWIAAAFITAVSLGYFVFTHYDNPPQLNRPILPPLAVQKLVVPLPVSVRELLANLTDYAEPLGLVTTAFKGYASMASANPMQLRVDRAPGQLKIFLRGREQKDPMLFQFKGDPDSLVARFVDMTFIYLKTEPNRTLQSYPQPLTVLSGWLIKPNKKTAKIVLIEEYHPSWPRVESLKEALPPDLPY